MKASYWLFPLAMVGGLGCNNRPVELFAEAQAASGTVKERSVADPRAASAPPSFLSSQKTDIAPLDEPLLKVADLAPGIGGDALFTLDHQHSTSLGSVTNGQLVGGVPLPFQGLGFRHNPLKRAEVRFGTVELIRMLVRAAADVATDFPGSTVLYNDLSLEGGGHVSGHASHRSGRDADVLFYLLDEQGRPRSGALIPLDPGGRGTDYRDLADPTDDVQVELDVPRTWRLITSLLESPHGRAQRLFLAEHLRTLLWTYAKRVQTEGLTLERFLMATCQPASPHDDHLHVRIYCSDGDIGAGCLDSPPVQPWRAQELALAGLRAALAGPRRGPQSDLTSAAAEPQPGLIHQSVLEFLAHRRGWLGRGRRLGGCFQSINQFD